MQSYYLILVIFIVAVLNTSNNIYMCLSIYIFISLFRIIILLFRFINTKIAGVSGGKTTLKSGPGYEALRT